jgi:exopolyphosphatase / guanosine-5'-triphosphate,3'-diphosphate pyrophosphatase
LAADRVRLWLRVYAARVTTNERAPDPSSRTAAPATRLTRLGVIDLGSNSGRLVLMLRQIHGIPLVVDELQATLRLAEGLQATGEIGEAGLERALAALRAFRSAAQQFGVEALICAGTSALRDASNGPAVLAQLEAETGVPVTVLSGEREAYYGYVAAVNSLPIENGLVLDLGGGSLELSFVRGRGCERAVSLPLGALRLSERALRGDPPARGEVAALRDDLAKQLRAAGVRPLPPGQLLAGSGGTVRTLAKIVRREAGLPSLRLHGYAMDGRALSATARTLLGQTVQQRRRIPGLPPERSDTIGAGALVVQAVMRAAGARSLLVCGQGLREGIAYEAFRASKSAIIRDPRRAGIDAFRERYVTGPLLGFTHEEGRESRHAVGPHPSDGVEPLALALLERLALALAATDDDRALLAAAAALCDVGRAISLYRWMEHAAYLLANGDLVGYTQREAVLIGQVIGAQTGARVVPSRPELALEEGEAWRAGQLGMVLGLARWLRRLGVDAAAPPRLTVAADSLAVQLPAGVPFVEDEWLDGLARGCRRYLDRVLIVTGG